MRARTLILFALAILLGIGTAMLARTWLAAQRTRELAQIKPPEAAQPARSVLVAHADIQRGQILRPDDVTWQTWPAGSIDKNYVQSGGTKGPESYAGWVAVNPIAGGEPITEGKIISPGNRGFLAAVLRPGTRAISVPVTVTSGISGFIFPGDYVDLLLTYPFPSLRAAAGPNQINYEHKASETVLRNIRVIGIDQRLQSKAGEAFPAHTATFEVTPKESEVIALASEIGKLSLTLHSLVGSSPEVGSGNTDTLAPPSSDSFNSAAVTYTVDSEISPLLPKFVSGKEESETATVTILRGAAKTSEASAAKTSEASSGVSKAGGAEGEPAKPAGGT